MKIIFFPRISQFFKGKIEAEGSYAQLMTQKIEFIKYLDNTTNEQSEEVQPEEEERIIPKLTRQNTEV